MKNRSPAVLALVFAGILLIPYLATGYYCDDVLNGCTRGFVGLNHLTIQASVMQDLRVWITQAGRFTPLGQAFHYFWYYLPSLEFYRWLQVGLTFSNIVLFAAFLRALNMPKTRLWLTCAIVPALFQIRNYHDPITSYSAMFQVAFLMGFGSMLLVLRHLRTGRPFSLFAGVLVYALQLLLYEAGVLFLPILLLLCWNEGQGSIHHRARNSSVWLIGITLLDFGTAIFLRHHFGTIYGGTRIGFQLWAVWAFICQTLAAFPLVYEFAGRGGLFDIRDLWGPEFVSVWTPLIAGFSAILFFKLSEAAKKEDPAPRMLRWVGLLLLLLPSVLIASSSRYQTEVSRPGQGYLPVYFAYFGAALLISEAAISWIRKGSNAHSRRIAFSVAAAITVIFVFNGNRVAARKLNEAKMGNRLLIEKAANAGLFSEIPEGAVVAHKEVGDWLIPECTYQIAHKRLTWLRHDPIRLLQPVPSDAFELGTGKNADGTEWVSLIGPRSSKHYQTHSM